MVRCLRLAHFFTTSLAIVSLILLADAKHVRRLKNSNRIHLKGSQNVRNDSPGSSPWPPYDSPSLYSGHNFDRNLNNKRRHDGLQHHPTASPGRGQGRNQGSGHRNRDGSHHHSWATSNPANSQSQSSFNYHNYEIDLDTKKQIRIAQIKSHILEELHFDKPPNMTGVVQSSNPEIKRLEESIDESASKVIRQPDFQRDMPSEFSDKKIFIPVESWYPFKYQVPNDTDIMYFKMSRGKISEAFLHLWIKPVRLSAGSKMLIEIFNVSAPVGEDDYVRYSLVSEDYQTVEPNKGRWSRFAVFSIVSRWAADPASNLGMMVDMRGPGGRQIAVTNASEMPDKAPLLEVQFIQEGDKANRLARSSEGGKCSIGETKCCRFPLPINFTEHSFDFIVAPKVYMANFCNGKCDYLYAQQHIHMAMVQKLNNATATYGPCCGAKERMPLNMLYYDHDRKIRFDTINDMIIEKCSCD